MVDAYPERIEELIINSNRLAAELADAEGELEKVELLVKDRMSEIVEEVVQAVALARVKVPPKKEGEGETEKPEFGSEDTRKAEVQRRLRRHPAYRALQFQDPELAGDAQELPYQPRTLLTRLALARRRVRDKRREKVGNDARLTHLRNRFNLLLIDYERQQLGQRRAS